MFPLLHGRLCPSLFLLFFPCITWKMPMSCCLLITWSLEHVYMKLMDFLTIQMSSVFCSALLCICFMQIETF
jgi:hypothetical protein